MPALQLCRNTDSTTRDSCRSHPTEPLIRMPAFNDIISFEQVNVATIFPWVLWALLPGMLIEPQFTADHSEAKEATTWGWGWGGGSLGDWALSTWNLTLSQAASSRPEVTVRTGNQRLLQSRSLLWRNLSIFRGHRSLGFIFPSTPFRHLPRS